MSNIRYRIHGVEMPVYRTTSVYYIMENTALHESDFGAATSENGHGGPNGMSPVDGLFSLLTMLGTNRMQDVLVDEAIQNSMDDEVLRRREGIELDLKEQKYHTTSGKYDSCVVCCETFNHSESVAVLPCGHVFHPKCVGEWGKYSPVCPTCKSPIPVL